MNIGSYMGGQTNPWMATQNKVALLDNQQNDIPRHKLQNVQPQSYNDGLLEFSTAETFFHIGLDSAVRVG